MNMEVERVFEMFDKNGDGRITKEELKESVERLGMAIPENELSAMLHSMDSNGDGCLDATEFANLYDSIIKHSESDMREAFSVFDANGDGFITVDELRTVLSSLGLKQGNSLEECNKMISKVDSDGDGRVNFTEFRHMMSSPLFSSSQS